MDVTTNLELSNEDTEELARILDCNVHDLPDNLSDYCAAALMEYVSMFLGQKIFRRGSDINEYRLSVVSR